MRTRFHDRTLGLLQQQNIDIQEVPVSALMSWSRANNISLPTAYVEWARLGGEELLSRYSNTDSFNFEEPEIVSTPDGVRGLVFHRENQGNFRKIVVLDGSDDPPVFFSWVNEPPWVTFASRFSDCVYAQIFDWQYMLYEGEITYYGNISLRTDRCVSLLRAQFEEAVTTRFVIDDKHTTEYRFFKPTSGRLTVGVHEETGNTFEKPKAYIVITGENASVKALEGELFEALSDDVLPPSFSYPRSATGELVRTIQYRGASQARHIPIKKMSLEAAARLLEFHRARPLEARLHAESFPETGSHFVLGDDDSGVRIHFFRQNKNWWWIERIELTR